VALHQGVGHKQRVEVLPHDLRRAAIRPPDDQHEVGLRVQQHVDALLRRAPVVQPERVQQREVDAVGGAPAAAQADIRHEAKQDGADRLPGAGRRHKAGYPGWTAARGQDQVAVLVDEVAPGRRCDLAQRVVHADQHIVPGRARR